MKLAPEAVRARKELAKRLDQRVETRREESGNASLSGRELDTTDVMASKAYIDAHGPRPGCRLGPPGCRRNQGSNLGRFPASENPLVLLPLPPPTARPSPTPAPPASTPGNRPTRKRCEDPVTSPHPDSQPS